MVELSTGFDIIAAVAQAATGDLKPIDVTTFKHRYSGLYYVVKQTANIKSIFDTCEKESWCWEKHFETDVYWRNELFRRICLHYLHIFDHI